MGGAYGFIPLFLEVFFQSLKFLRKFGVQLMAAEDGDDVRMKRADEGNVSQDVEYLMTDKFVGEAQLREAFGLGVNDCSFLKISCAPYFEIHLYQSGQTPVSV